MKIYVYIIYKINKINKIKNKNAATTAELIKTDYYSPHPYPTIP